MIFYERCFMLEKIISIFAFVVQLASFALQVKASVRLKKDNRPSSK